MLKNPKVSQRVEFLREYMNEKSILKREEALLSLSNMVRTDIGDTIAPSVEKFKNLPANVRSSVQSFELFPDGRIKVRMYNKIDAIDRLSKLLGWDAPSKQEITNKDDNVYTIRVVTKKEDLPCGDSDD